MEAYNDRNFILDRLKDNKVYRKYVDDLFLIYKQLEKNLTCFNIFLLMNCKSKIEGHIGISGGMLYWFIYQEALNLNLTNFIDEKIKKKFEKFRSVDFDLQCKVYSENFSENSKYFEFCMLNFFLGISNHNLFENIENILGAKIQKHEIPITKKIGFIFNVNDNEDSASFQEYRPQIIFNSGKEIDHVIEMLMIRGNVTLHQYNLIKSQKYFYGEHIMDSIPTQCFPRFLNTTKNILNPIKEIKEDFIKNPLAKLKFEQGGIRVNAIYSILKELETNTADEVNGLKSTLICENSLLTKNLFRFRSKSIGKILPQNLINESLEFRRILLKLDQNSKSSIKNLIFYCSIYLKTWDFFLNK